MDQLRQKRPILRDLVAWCEEALEEQEPMTSRRGKTKTALKDLRKNLSAIFDEFAQRPSKAAKTHFLYYAMCPLEQKNLLTEKDRSVLP